MSEIDRELRTAMCSICGPEARVEIKAKNGAAECQRRKQATSNLRRRGKHLRRKRSPEPVRRRWLRNRYGLSLAQYAELVEVQKNRCAICQETPEGYHLAVDHCHETGRIRGLLCKSCNIGIGNLRDSIQLLQRASEYLAGPGTRLFVPDDRRTDRYPAPAS